ncbi:MAG: serine/threonine-protein phosphatase [Planctomycetes bacterium]|nr:serine/threonine-protein phosphatase [Planctomycetota bacterium]
MKLPPGIALGVATHTGLVRSTNEDDYLIAVGGFADRGLLCAIADGMGGAAGGAEASRSALRAFGVAVLEPGPDVGPESRIATGFAAACRRVHVQASSVPALLDMGTTLTAVLLTGEAAHLGHVGDTRVYRLRGGELVQLTQDHALREPDNLLTRCIGGGQANETPDIGSVQLQRGDRLLLVSDGVWSVVPPPLLAKALATPEPQSAADQIVRAALLAGGPDNATAIVVAMGDGRAAGAVELPREELVRVPELAKTARSLRRPAWPWLLLLVAVLLALVALARWYRDLLPWPWLQAVWT